MIYPPDLVTPYDFTDPHEQRRDKEGILCRVDRVRGLVEMTARLMILDGGRFGDFGAALELAHAELQRIREEIDVGLVPRRARRVKQESKPT